LLAIRHFGLPFACDVLVYACSFTRVPNACELSVLIVFSNANHNIPVGAAEGCDLLILISMKRRSKDRSLRQLLPRAVHLLALRLNQS
jgi:hypothetical protein